MRLEQGSGEKDRAISVVHYNNGDDHCVENRLLRKLYQALDAEDNGTLDEAADARISLVRPFMTANYIKRVDPVLI
jgi:hypothetical protein